MKTYDLYGIKESNLEDARTIVELALGICLVPHESSYHCGDYYRLDNDNDENFILQNNFDPFEQEWTEEKFQNFEILLYVNQTVRAEEIQRLLTEKVLGIALLKREVL